VKDLRELDLQGELDRHVETIQDQVEGWCKERSERRKYIDWRIRILKDRIEKCTNLSNFFDLGWEPTSEMLFMLLSA